MVLRRAADRGASAVEFALVMPILFVLLFGLISTGFVFSNHLAATNAVREAARYGAATSYSTNPGGWATSVKDRVKQVYFNAGNPITDSEICVKLVNPTGATVTTGASYSGAGCGTAPAAPSNMAAGTCAVMVWVKRPESIELMVFPDLDLDIGAKSVAFYSRTDGSCTA